MFQQMTHSRNITKKAEMFIRRYLFLNLFLVCGITFHSSGGSGFKNRKQIYDIYVSSLKKFEGEWRDPYSLGIEFEEELEDFYIEVSEEIMSNQEKETLEIPKSFSKQRLLPKNKLIDGFGISDIFMTDRNSIFTLRNMMIAAALLIIVVCILLLIFPKSLLIWFVLILNTLWHWMKLYQEKIAEKQNITENLRHPNECHRADLHWYEAIYLYISSYVSSQTDCKEYYKAQFVDPFWEVSLPIAMMNAFTSTICEPMKVLATTIRFCFAVIFSGLTLLELSITLFSLFIFLLMQYGYSFSFCWGAISLHRPRRSADQTASQSFSCLGWITKCLKAVLFRETALICSSEVNIPPDRQKITFSSKGDKIKVSEKPNEFQKQEKNIINVRQNTVLQSVSLNSKKNPTMELNIPPDSQKLTLISEGDKIKVSEKPDEFQKQEKSTNNIRENVVLQSVSLHSKKNPTRFSLKVSQFRKRHKLSFLLKKAKYSMSPQR